MRPINAPEIKKLQEAVINRIAAGEVVQRPASAVKEMIENSIDAGSTKITVLTKGGGFDLLQIQDNGHGIRREDLPILCERFTTSKLKNFEDLQTIQTFGFRGEALASISYVSEVTVTTKTADSTCAFKAKYLNGKLVPMQPGAKDDPKPCAGVNGTIISAENLFYNLPSRRQAFKDPNEQYQLILDVLTKYSIHYGNKHVSFTCKRFGHQSPDLHTPESTSTIQNIRISYGPQIANNLIELAHTENIGSYNAAFELETGNSIRENRQHSINSTSHTSFIQSFDSSYEFGTNNLLENQGIGENYSGRSDLLSNQLESDSKLQLHGYITNPNYTNKKLQFILFINNRLVESHSIKKVIDAIYCEILPKHCHPFVYLSILMPPENVDVNVHPTKKEVHFLHEDVILETLYINLRKLLLLSNKSRTFQPMLGSNNSNFKSLNASNSSIKFQMTLGNEDTQFESARISQPNPTIEMTPPSSEEHTDPSQQHAPQPYTAAATMQGSDASASSKSPSKALLNCDLFPAADDSTVWGGVTKAEVSSTEAASILSSNYTQQEYAKSSSAIFPITDLKINSIAGKSANSSIDKSKPLKTPSISTSSGAVPAHKYIRTDVTARKLESFYAPVPAIKSRISHNYELKSNQNIQRPFPVSSEHDAKLSKTRVDSLEIGAVTDEVNNIYDLAFDGDENEPCICCPVNLFPYAMECQTKPPRKRKIESTVDSGTTIVNHGPTAVTSKKQIKIINSSIQLPFVKESIESIYNSQHDGVTHVIRHHSFIGHVSDTSCLIQYQTKIILMNFHHVSIQLFRQLVVRQLGHLSILQLPSNGIDIKMCIQQALIVFTDHTESYDINAIVSIYEYYQQVLKSYFQISISIDHINHSEKNLKLLNLPDILTGYIPCQEYVPIFLTRLALQLSFHVDKSCAEASLTPDVLRIVSDELSMFYAHLPDDDAETATINSVEAPSGSMPSSSSTSAIHELNADSKEKFDSYIYPAICTELIPDGDLANQDTFLPIASLEKLYRVFERC